MRVGVCVCKHCRKETKWKSNATIVGGDTEELRGFDETKTILCQRRRVWWRRHNGVTLEQRPSFIILWHWMAAIWLCTEGRGRRGGGRETAVWLYQDQTLRSSLSGPYLGHGSVLTKRLYSLSPCSCDHIMREKRKKKSTMKTDKNKPRKSSRQRGTRRSFLLFLSWCLCQRWFIKVCSWPRINC